MESFCYTIKDEVGIHARPAGMLAKLAKGFKSEIMIEPIEQIKKAKETDKISGSWLITGGYDYEKISFIYNICSVLLNKKYKDKTLFEPDVKWLECGLTDEAKRDIQKMILAGKSVDTDKTLSYKR